MTRVIWASAVRPDPCTVPAMNTPTPLPQRQRRRIAETIHVLAHHLQITGDIALDIEPPGAANPWRFVFEVPNSEEFDVILDRLAFPHARQRGPCGSTSCD